MFPMNNPMMQLMNIARSGGDPTSMLRQIAGANPMAAGVLRALQGKSPAEQRRYAENIARERGINLDDFVRGLGLPL